MEAQKDNSTVSHGLRHRRSQPDSSKAEEWPDPMSSTTEQESIEKNPQGWSSGFEPLREWGNLDHIFGLTTISDERTGRKNRDLIDFIKTTYRAIGKSDNGRPGLYYCAACDNARDESNYVKRVKSLMSEIKCSACGSSRFAMNFSTRQRAAGRGWKPSTGLCVGHEGCWKPCSHLGLSWSDVVSKDWSTKSGFEKQEDGWAITIRCDHSDHNVNERPTVKITFREGEKAAKEVFILEYSQTLFPREADTLQNQIEACISKVLDRDVGNSMLCPHFKIAPDVIRNFHTHKRYPDDEMKYECVCFLCGFTIRFCLADRIHRVQPCIQCSQNKILDKIGSMNEERGFSAMVDPESYGLFSDEESKNILWCEDKQCATTFQLVSSYLAMTILETRGQDFHPSTIVSSLGGWRNQLIQFCMYRRGDLKPIP